jgi:hypothetical protein
MSYEVIKVFMALNGEIELSEIVKTFFNNEFDYPRGARPVIHINRPDHIPPLIIEGKSFCDPRKVFIGPDAKEIAYRGGCYIDACKIEGIVIRTTGNARLEFISQCFFMKVRENDIDMAKLLDDAQGILLIPPDTEPA